MVVLSHTSRRGRVLIVWDVFEPSVLRGIESFQGIPPTKVTIKMKHVHGSGHVWVWKDRVLDGSVAEWLKAPGC